MRGGELEIIDLEQVGRQDRRRRWREAVGLGGSAATTARPSRWLDDITAQTPSDIRLLVPAGMAWAVCAALLGAPGWAGALTVGLSALVAWRSVRRPRRSSPLAALCALVVAVVTLAMLAQRGVRTAGTLDELSSQRASVTLVGQVVADPRLLPGGEERPPKVMLRVGVDEVRGRGARSRVAAPVLVFAGREWLGVRWGERVELAGRLDRAEPGDDVVAVVQVRGPPRVVHEASAVARAAEHVRAGLREAVAGTPADAAGLVPGLVIGDTSLTPPDLSADMTAVQMSHLSAVSGVNNIR